MEVGVIEFTRWTGRSRTNHTLVPFRYCKSRATLQRLFLPDDLKRNQLQLHANYTSHTMGKDKSEKKEEKEKKVAEDGVKKEKKEKKEKRKSTDATTAVLSAVEDAKSGAVDVDADGDITIDGAADVINTDNAVITVPKSALVPFANPLCDEKSGKKVLKTVKKGQS